ncbi:hypothetical protein M408DRAFT_12902 [Serendipita vermifera MAFF 305830]|uniref:Uncharacterized protein n=1 Tax=Serendipita vermifera MAFF 305830 TaxID=933852 RepID=A0A0C2W2Q7_SERVB|nr:hypothetical protein M408DRAFT_12902 [Serendipita vermifera MAFF 305830]
MVEPRSKSHRALKETTDCKSILLPREFSWIFVNLTCDFGATVRHIGRTNSALGRAAPSQDLCFSPLYGNNASFCNKACTASAYASIVSNTLLSPHSLGQSRDFTRKAVKLMSKACRLIVGYVELKNAQIIVEMCRVRVRVGSSRETVMLLERNGRNGDREIPPNADRVKGRVKEVDYCRVPMVTDVSRVQLCWVARIAEARVLGHGEFQGT